MNKVSPLNALTDLAIFLSVMFLVREIRIDTLGFWGQTLFRTITTVAVATVLLRYRKQTWKTLGLSRPTSLLRALGVSAIILAGTVISLVIFETFIRDLLFSSTAPTIQSKTELQIHETAPYFFSVLLFVWIESFLEELQDRGFSLNRFNTLFGKTQLATALAVLSQAAIFGFRHSYDFSPRSITVGLIGLVFGIVYVLTGRNLWPLIVAHIILNTMSIADVM